MCTFKHLLQIGIAVFSENNSISCSKHCNDLVNNNDSCKIMSLWKGTDLQSNLYGFNLRLYKCYVSIACFQIYLIHGFQINCYENSIQFSAYKDKNSIRNYASDTCITYVIFTWAPLSISKFELQFPQVAIPSQCSQHSYDLVNANGRDEILSLWKETDKSFCHFSPKKTNEKKEFLNMDWQEKKRNNNNDKKRIDRKIKKRLETFEQVPLVVFPIWA